MAHSPQNPYESPSGGPAKQSSTNGVDLASYLFTCLVWLALSAALWFTQDEITPIYRDYGVEVSWVSQAFLHRSTPIILLIIGLGVAAMLAIATPAQRYAMAIGSLLLAFIVATVAVFSLFEPLISLLNVLR